VLVKTFRQARERPDCADIARIALCALVALTGFCVAIIFLSLAYTFYLPTLAGFAVGLSRAAAGEFRIRPQGPPRALSYAPTVPAGARMGISGHVLPAAGRPA